jgi:ribosomal protein S18 acetylase RimI-like enzyme
VTLLLRPAVRTAADAEALARGLEQASDGTFSVLFGRAAERLLARMALVDGHRFSLEHVTIAEVDGAIAGIMSGMPAAETGDPRRVLPRIAGWRSIRAAAVAVAGRQLFRALDRHEAGDWYLQALAVVPGHRGRGIGTLLLEEGFRRARAAQARRLTLDVDVANTGAMALYRRAGLEVTGTYGPARLLGGVALHRMVAELAER